MRKPVMFGRCIYPMDGGQCGLPAKAGFQFCTKHIAFAPKRVKANRVQSIPAQSVIRG